MRGALRSSQAVLSFGFAGEDGDLLATTAGGCQGARGRDEGVKKGRIERDMGRDFDDVEAGRLWI